jgi:mRNA-degrading endonuclease HigB of HigAB toxin-antitoxin module
MDFDALQEFAHIITKNKIKNIEVLGNDNKSETKVSAFYDGLSDRKWKNEEDVITNFFDKNSDKQPYNKLKNRLIQQLINTSFFVDANAPQFSERNIAYTNCHKIMQQ